MAEANTWCARLKVPTGAGRGGASALDGARHDRAVPRRANRKQLETSA